MNTLDQHAGTVTKWLKRACAGDQAARDAIFEKTYSDLRAIAASIAAGMRRSHNDTTSIVNQACERIISRERLDVSDRRHFYNLFGVVLRGVLVDEFRAASAQKRENAATRISLEQISPSAPEFNVDAIDLEHAMKELGSHDQLAAEAINLRYFCGATIQDAAQAMGCSIAVFRTHFDYGLAWLRIRMGATPN